jgi:nucleoside-triphosphatase
MNNVILLTGLPGCGKTTLIRRIISLLPGPVHGFYTQEIRQPSKLGKKQPRLGFEIITLDDQRGVLAHVDPAKVNRRTKPRLGRYIINIPALETLAVPRIRKAIEEGGWAVVDEIGPMEIHSDSFCQAVEEVLDSQTNLLGTIVRRSTPFSDQIKARSEVTLLEVTTQNRDTLLEYVLSLIGTT